MTVTVGLDPELFVRERNNMTVLPSCGIVGGSKEKPLSLGGDGYFVQEDNISVEFNVPPARSAEEACDILERGLERVAEHVLCTYKRDDAILSYSPVAYVPEPVLRPHRGAFVFGCAPEFCAYTSDNECTFGPPAPSAQDWITGESNIHRRFAGGHIHIGYEQKVSSLPVTYIARLCDLMIGLLLVGVDKQGDRRAYNGQPGRFRPTRYGIEYRTPSCAWIDPVANRHAWGGVFGMAFALGRFVENADLATLQNVFAHLPTEDIRDAIATENVAKADDLWSYAESHTHLKEVFAYYEQH